MVLGGVEAPESATSKVPGSRSQEPDQLTRNKDCTAPTRFLKLPHLRVKGKESWPSVLCRVLGGGLPEVSRKVLFSGLALCSALQWYQSFGYRLLAQFLRVGRASG